MAAAEAAGEGRLELGDAGPLHELAPPARLLHDGLEAGHEARPVPADRAQHSTSTARDILAISCRECSPATFSSSLRFSR